MGERNLLAGALNLLLHHERYRCVHATRRAVSLLLRLAEDPDAERDTRTVCERMCEPLPDSREGGGA